ncbi:MAG TPA: preprotein translocase subunit SecY [Ardenticatenaceae bacterium]|nr:preprotein translocase subunit SecY [Ardenticatenaceae bacterium]
MLTAVRNAFRLPDLRNKILFTLFILVVYRICAHVPVPGVDQRALDEFLRTNPLGAFYDLLSGGALANFSVMAMGVYPYITASIIMQLLVPLIPQLEELSKEGEQGRNTINKYTYWLAVPLALLQGIGQAALMRSAGVLPDFGFSGANLLPTVTTLIALTAGTMFALWLGELITERGIGQGISIIIFGGIVSRAPQNVAQMWATSKPSLVVFVILSVVTVLAIVVIQEGQRRIPVQYGKRVRGTRVYGGQSTHIPLRVNAAGMIPIIFAQSILIFPGIVASYLTAVSNPTVRTAARTVESLFNSTNWVYWIAYFIMVVGFTYFYTDVIFRQQNLGETLRRQGGFVPGIRPGRPTADYLNGVLQRITLVGALFLGIIAILSWLARVLLTPLGISLPAGQTDVMVISAVGLLIVVGVVLDTMKQLEAQLLMRHYEGFIRR